MFLLSNFPRLLILLLNITWPGLGRKTMPQSLGCEVRSLRDTQPSWVAGPEHERQLVMTSLVSLAWGDAENRPAAHMMQLTLFKWELRLP